MVLEDIVLELHIVNGTAKHGIALMQELNALLTKDEKQTQFAIRVIKCYQDSKRENLVKGLGSPKCILLAHLNEKAKPTVGPTFYITVCTLCSQKPADIVTLQSSGEKSEYYNIRTSSNTFYCLFWSFSSI